MRHQEIVNLTVISDFNFIFAQNIHQSSSRGKLKSPWSRWKESRGADLKRLKRDISGGVPVTPPPPRANWIFLPFVREAEQVGDDLMEYLGPGTPGGFDPAIE